MMKHKRKVQGVSLARCHWMMKNDVRTVFKSDVSGEKRILHVSQVEDKHTIFNVSI